MNSHLLILIALAACIVGCSKTSKPFFSESTLFTSGQGGYPSYRIPTAILTSKGSVLIFCEGRKKPSDTGEIHLLMRRSTDGGVTFSPPEVIWSDGANTCGNPCPVVDESTGTIHLLLTHNLGQDSEKQIIAGTSKESRTVWHMSSDDDGLTWTTPREITRDVKKADWAWYATGPGVGIQLTQGPHKGRLVIPCDYIALHSTRGNSHVIYSDDHGLTWHLGGEPPNARFNESQIVELADGRLLLNMRNHRTKPSTAPGSPPLAPVYRGITFSSDAGLTFSAATHDSVLLEPICQASILRIGSTILFSNPASTKRERMTVRASFDNAQSWKHSKLITPNLSAYSCLTRLPDGTIGLFYETGEKTSTDRLVFARFNLEWLASADPAAHP